MAFDNYQADRIRRILSEKKITFLEKRMMGVLVFMANNKMLCGIHIDKKSGDSLLMARVGEKIYKTNIGKKECLPMDFTGKPSKTYIYITPNGFDLDSNLEFWIQLTLDYNLLIK